MEDFISNIEYLQLLQILLYLQKYPIIERKTFPTYQFYSKIPAQDSDRSLKKGAIQVKKTKSLRAAFLIILIFLLTPFSLRALTSGEEVLYSDVTNGSLNPQIAIVFAQATYTTSGDMDFPMGNSVQLFGCEQAVNEANEKYTLNGSVIAITTPEIYLGATHILTSVDLMAPPDPNEVVWDMWESVHGRSFSHNWLWKGSHWVDCDDGSDGEIGGGPEKQETTEADLDVFKRFIQSIPEREDEDILEEIQIMETNQLTLGQILLVIIPMVLVVIGLTQLRKHNSGKTA